MKKANKQWYYENSVLTHTCQKKKKAFEFLFIKYRYKKRDKHNLKKGLVKEI